MKTFKKVLSISGMVVCGLFFLVFVLGIAGVWVVRSGANQAVNSVFDKVDEALVKADSHLVEMDQNRDEMRSALAALTAEIESVGQTVEDNPVVLTAVDKALDGKLSEGLQKIDQAGSELYASLTQVETALNLLMDLSIFSDTDGMIAKLESLMEEITTALEELNSSFSELTASAQALKSETTNKVVDTLSQPIEKLDGAIAKSQDRLADTQAGLQTLSTSLDTARAALLNLITIATVAMTLILAWLAYTQFATARSLLRTYQSLRAKPLIAEPEPAAA
jgi:chromosome segregation ATPase